ncbi:hypothetical protein B0189_03180 [Moraxella cuniculi]|nr:hypothetical protein B0189_03180 [Moraxella cuniculi]
MIFGRYQGGVKAVLLGWGRAIQSLINQHHLSVAALGLSKPSLAKFSIASRCSGWWQRFDLCIMGQDCQRGSGDL